MKKSVVGRLLGYTKPHCLALLAALLCAVVQISLTLLGPVLVGKGIDLIVEKGQVDFPGIARILLMLGITVLSGAAFQWLMTLCTNRVTYYTVRDLRESVFCKLNRVSIGYIDSSSRGDLISRIINDVDQISDGLLQGITQLFTGVVTILGTLLFMLTIDLKVTLAVVLITPLSLFVASFVAKLSNGMFHKQSKTQGELSGYVEELFGGQKTVKIFGYEEQAQERFEKINSELYEYGVKSQFYSSLSNPSTRFVNSIVYAAVGVLGAVSAISGGGLTVGQISCFLSYASQYTKPFNEVTAVLTQLQTALASARRVFAVLDSADESPDPPDALVLADCEGRVKAERVSFSYLPERPLIQDFNVSVAPGQKIAIVGPTGCGKTTFINLLMRFYDVEEGVLSVDGHPIREITRSSLRNLYGMVLQDTWLTSGTVRENIAYARPDATLGEVISAAKSAHAHGFIKRLPQGYDTLISDSDGNLSQGQRQLLCIARVMLMNPPMLILDEATSSIDTRTELHIQKAFSKMMKGRTSFIVAHRLSTIREADVILVMKEGNIVEQGSHGDLLRQGGFYAELYRSQFAAEE